MVLCGCAGFCVGVLGFVWVCMFSKKARLICAQQISEYYLLIKLSVVDAVFVAGLWVCLDVQCMFDVTTGVQKKIVKACAGESQNNSPPCSSVVLVKV